MGISVVVASFSRTTLLEQCLQSLLPQQGDAEIVVARNAPVAELAARYPTVRFLEAPATADVFRLRAQGAAAAQGDLIVLTEDHVTVAAGWLAALGAAHAQGRRVLGGPVDNGRVQSGYGWALYFCEYGIYMPPQPEGPVGVLSGINIAYDRALLDGCREIWQEALHENEINDALRATGHELYVVPDACVKSYLGMTLKEGMAHLFSGGRHFGLYRRGQSSGGKRLLWALAAPLVPFVLLLRIVKRTAARQPRRLWQLLRGLPSFFCLLGSWSAGEAYGYVGPRKS